jgi:hypothetical protein
MTPDEFRAVLRSLSAAAIIEAVADVILVAVLLTATVSAPKGIDKILAVVAVGVIIVGMAAIEG